MARGCFAESVSLPTYCVGEWRSEPFEAAPPVSRETENESVPRSYESEDWGRY